MPEAEVMGWDIGGAHVKVARLAQGEVRSVAQWPCPLWQGMQHLDAAVQSARARWPDLGGCTHAVTMTGEMVDLFAHREDGVRRIAALLGDALSTPRFFAGDAPWCEGQQAGDQWRNVASANWLATARHAAQALAPRSGVLVDIGSTTTDLIAFRDGRVLSASRSDAQRLEHNELVYQGVVRTPLCALAQRIAWRDRSLNVMNEFFATTADVYRLTGELNPAHDQHPSADGAAKDDAATRTRLARMIGLDACDGTPALWLAFARAWRTRQLDGLREQLARVLATHQLTHPAALVAAGCGAFLVPMLLPAGWRCLDYASDVARISAAAPAETAGWARVCAPSVAVAALFAREQR